MSIIVLDIAAVVVWLGILIKLDDYRVDKKSTGVIISFYAAGLFSVVPAHLLYYIIPQPVPGSNTISLVVTYLCIVGPVEELSKFILFFILSRTLRAIKEPRDGILHAASVGLAFASVENFIYGVRYGSGVVIIRSVLSMSGHMVYSGITGAIYAMIVFGNVKKQDHDGYLLIFCSFLPGAFIHGIYDFFLETGMIGVAMFVKLVSIIGIIFLYRFMVRISPFRRFSMNQYNLAIEILKQGLHFHPESIILNQRLAFFYLYAGNYEQSFHYLNQCLKKVPKNPYLNSFKGILLVLLGNSEAGKKLFYTSLSECSGPKKRMLRNNIPLLIRDKKLKKELLKELE
jgi:RsiW-degrading membrane proteinase PrsW (M82 family)